MCNMKPILGKKGEEELPPTYHLVQFRFGITHTHTCLFSQTTSSLPFSGFVSFHTSGTWVSSFLVMGPSCANIICYSIQGLYPLDGGGTPQCENHDVSRHLQVFLGGEVGVEDI